LPLALFLASRSALFNCLIALFAVFVAFLGPLNLPAIATIDLDRAMTRYAGADPQRGASS